MAHNRRNIPELRSVGRRRFGRRRGGQILVLAILAITMLVSLIFYVYNVGDQVNRRMAMQDSSDSAVISGAGWMARSMNVVAMNNIAQARMISLAVVLDSMPLAAEMSIAEETGDDKLADALQNWRTVGSAFTQYEKDNFYREGLAELYRQLTEGQDDEGEEHYSTRQLELLKRIDQTFDSSDEKNPEGVYEIENDTHWWPAGGSSQSHGSIWAAAIALDEFSQATAESAGLLAQSNAVRFGSANTAATAFLTPVAPEFPGLRRDFSQFESLFSKYIYVLDDPRRERYEHRVVNSDLVGKLQRSKDIPWDIRRISVRGGAIPDFVWPQRMGPFSHVYQWRDYHHQRSEAWGRSSWQWERRGYSTYGPLEHAIRVVRSQFGEAGHYWSGSGSADTSRFSYHLRTIAKLKLAYLFGLASPQKVQYPSEWITDYNEALAFIGGENGVEVHDIVSRFLIDNIGAGAAQQGTWIESAATGEYADSSLETDNVGASFTWTASIPVEGAHRVYARWSRPMDGSRRNSAAEYQITHSGGTATVTRNQNSSAGGWVRLGTYNFVEGQSGKVTLTHPNAADGSTCADAVRFVPLTRRGGSSSSKSTIMKTRWYRVRVKSTVHWDESSHWMTTYESQSPTPTYTPIRWHSYQLRRGTDLGNARIQPLHRWIYEPTGWRNIGGWEKLADFVWIRKWQRRVAYDYALRLARRYELNPDGSMKLDKNGRPIPIRYTIYYVEWRTFGGIEPRQEHEVSNPIEGANRNELPAPFLVNTDDEQIEEFTHIHEESGREMNAVRVAPYTYLGVARRSSQAAVWSQKFANKNPTGDVFTMSQAKVFNNRSWDLWTQYWQVQLMRVDDWQGWTEKIGQGIEQAPVVDDTSLAEELEKAYEYMSALPEEMVELFMKH